MNARVTVPFVVKNVDDTNEAIALVAFVLGRFSEQIVALRSEVDSHIYGIDLRRLTADVSDDEAREP